MSNFCQPFGFLPTKRVPLNIPILKPIVLAPVEY